MSLRLPKGELTFGQMRLTAMTLIRLPIYSGLLTTQLEDYPHRRWRLDPPFGEGLFRLPFTTVVRSSVTETYHLVIQASSFAIEDIS